MCVTTQPNNAPQVLASARTDLSLSDITTLRIGGPISTYVETHSEDELVQVVEYADANSIDILVVGGGSNIVAADEGFDGIVVRDMRSGVNIDQVDSCGGGSVTVPAGHNWDDFVVQSIAEGWIGIESLIGIPGSVGAAPVQNIGAYGAEVLRGAIRSVNPGQHEACHALNMTPATRFRRIILPQALLAAIPPGTNLLIELLKNTSLVSLITLSDLAFRARQLDQATLMTLEIFGLALVIYFVLAQLINACMRLLYRRLARGQTRGGLA